MGVDVKSGRKPVKRCPGDRAKGADPIVKSGLLFSHYRRNNAPPNYLTGIKAFSKHYFAVAPSSAPIYTYPRGIVDAVNAVRIALSALSNTEAPVVPLGSVFFGGGSRGDDHRRPRSQSARYREDELLSNAKGGTRRDSTDSRAARSNFERAATVYTLQRSYVIQDTHKNTACTKL